MNKIKPSAVNKLIKHFVEAMNLLEEASSLLDYEDEKNPTYGIKYRCEALIKKARRQWCK